MSGTVSIDEQLATLAERRERCLDLLCRSLIELDTLADRANVLLDRKLAGAVSIDQTDQMT